MTLDETPPYTSQELLMHASIGGVVGASLGGLVAIIITRLSKRVPPTDGSH